MTKTQRTNVKIFENRKGEAFFAVVGRIPGSDEDDCLTMQADSQKDALAQFTERLYQERGGVEGAARLMAEITAEYKEAIYITHVLRSETPLELVG